MSERMARVQLVLLEVRRLEAEAKSCSDVNRMATIKQELQVLCDSMHEIRREQLLEEIERSKPRRSRRRWWRRTSNQDTRDA